MGHIRQRRVDAALERVLGLTRNELSAFGLGLRLADPGLVMSLGIALGLRSNVRTGVLPPPRFELEEETTAAVDSEVERP